ncbi:hypothetical protein AALP_AAs43032U000300 [Arabis alpina]|uniref:Transposase MuDR plant domain-containing protein n=1 Tax=Arabis alpina TaxID=50452 RepID=A0A087FX06_ARAAL|nr:hypothetical protein AALP_AAs43032U000300 [Arabis alpina]
MSRVVRLTFGTTFAEVRNAIVSEFGFDVTTGSLSLSFWPSQGQEHAVDFKRPPVLVTTDVSFGVFVSSRSNNRDLNLFATLGSSNIAPTSDSFADDSVFGTPDLATQQLRGDSFFGRITESLESEALPTAGSKTKDPPLGFVGAETSSRNRWSNTNYPAAKKPCVQSPFSIFANTCKGKASSSATLSEDDELIANVEAWEASYSFHEPNPPIPADEEDDEDLGPFESPDDVYVPPRGYDTEFWDAFINDEYGGSNAADIMCIPVHPSHPATTKPQFGSKKAPVKGGKRTGPKGKGSTIEIPNHTILGTKTGGQENMDTAAETTVRNLSEIDDEEFDIPPLFDDTLYESIQIPDLDVDADGEEIYVGKVFANKKGCQIALAIHAIKGQFHFRQTTTKRRSFVLTCKERTCHWRVLAAEKKTNFNYEIRKVNLIHTCPLDIRNAYKEKVTSRIIASVIKHKYSNLANGPRPMDLQQLVLEDLGITASYMKCWRAKEKAVVDVRGREEDSYLALPEFLRRLKLANPESGES